MNRPIVRQKSLDTMDIGLESTGPQCISKTVVPEEYRQSLLMNIPHLDGLFGQLIPGMTIAVGAHPGTGKTTLFLQIASILAKGHLKLEPQRVCFISGEQDLGMIKMTADRIGIDATFDIMNETNLAVIEKLIDSGDYDMVIVDSLHSVYAAGISGTNKTVKHVTNTLHKAAKKNKVIVIMICHSTLEGKIKGGTLVTHTIDCELYIHRHKKMVRKIYTEKNRMGATGEVYLRMTGTGFDLHNVINPETCMTRQEEVGSKLVDHMEGYAALSRSALLKLCNQESFDLEEAMHVLNSLVESDKVVKSDDLWLINDLV